VAVQDRRAASSPLDQPLPTLRPQLRDIDLNPRFVSQAEPSPQIFVSTSPVPYNHLDTAQRMDLLVFDVGGIRCALPAGDVREVVRAVTIVPLPNAPDVVEGVINVRGSLVPVIDLRQRLGLAARTLAITDHLVLVHTGEHDYAVRVDQAVDVVTVPDGQLEAPTREMTVAPFITAVGKLPDGLVVVHDLRRFLSGAEQTALEAARREEMA
jgi:purine-binding chemotaxis protein CheW